MDKELKLCPFCGGMAEFMIKTNSRNIEFVFCHCTMCNAQGKTFTIYDDEEKDFEKAKRAWNRRVSC